MAYDALKSGTWEYYELEPTIIDQEWALISRFTTEKGDAACKPSGEFLSALSPGRRTILTSLHFFYGSKLYSQRVEAL